MEYSASTGTNDAPVLSALPIDSLVFAPSSAPRHPLQDPTFSNIPHSIESILKDASQHLHSDRLVAFPTETVYGLGASSLSLSAVSLVYKLKGRPPDNPLIIHVSSLRMLYSLLPTDYTLSPLYLALITAFWPGPLTLLFPNPNPPPLPAPQTLAIRFPSHPLARALIQYSNLPISAPSANSSGRPSPTTAQHVAVDLGRKPRNLETGELILGCILDAGPCDVGLESTVIDGLSWSAKDGGVLKVLRPGGVGVEELKKVAESVDDEVGLSARGLMTEIWVHGQSSPSPTAGPPKQQPNGVANPSTPGMKYKHYSPSIPVFLLLPSTSFSKPASVTTSRNLPIDVVERIASFLPRKAGKPTRFGLMHFDSSPLSASLLDQGQEPRDDFTIKPLNMGSTPADAARSLFSGLLALEAKKPLINGCEYGMAGDSGEGVHAILIEGCSSEGIGLAVMERAGKAVGGGGKGGLGTAQGDEGRFWVDVGSAIV